jgi:hypothetical protein
MDDMGVLRGSVEDAWHATGKAATSKNNNLRIPGFWASATHPGSDDP